MTSSTQRAEGDPLTAQFVNAPSSHDGTEFTFELAFSEAPDVTAKKLKNDSLSVSGGSVSAVSAIGSDGRRWNVTVDPDGEGQVTVSLVLAQACEETGAVCTSDGRLLDVSPAQIVRGPVSTGTPLTAEFIGVPASHGGQAFTFELAFSEALEDSFSNKTLKGDDETASILTVTNGSVTRASRIVKSGDDRNRRFTMGITPDGNGDVTVTLPASVACGETGAMCTEDERALSAAVTATVPTSAGTPDTQQQTTANTTPVTAQFVGVPAEHAGDTFTFELAFSESLKEAFSNSTLKGGGIAVTNGTVVRASRIVKSGDERNRRYTIGIEPTGNGDVEVRLPASPACDQTGAMCTEDGRALTGTLGATILGPPGLSVADATVTEAAGAVLDFVVTLSRGSTSTVTVDYATSDGTATAGSDYTATSGTLTFAPGETSHTVSVPVLDDAVDDSDETLTLTLSNASGGNAYIADNTATGTIENNDSMPREWITRFGRTVAGQAVDAIGGRLEGPRSSHVTVGGVSLSAEERTHEQQEELERALAVLAENGAGRESLTHSMSAHELLLGTSFQLSAAGEGGSPGFTAWGEVAMGGFEADADDTRLDGSVTTGFVGADVGSDRWLAGLALSLSEGDGDYALMEGADQGDVESSMTTVYPYVQLGLSESLDVWGLAGWGHGELTLRQHANESRQAQSYTTDVSLQMGALGVRGEVVSPDQAGALAVAVKSDVFWVTTQSDAVTNEHGKLGAAEGDASRIRLLVEGSKRLDTGGGALTPSLEVGLRHDAGDAETGTGIEAGAGLRYEGAGFSAEGNIRMLVAHEESGYEEWGASGAVRIHPGRSGRGLSLTLAPSWGAASGTGHLWSAPSARGIAPEYEYDAVQRVDAEVGYGLGGPWSTGIVTPYAGLSLGEAGHRTWRSGARWQVAVGLEATREAAGEGQDATSGVLLRGSMRW